MQPNDHDADRAALLALELAMREVLDGMAELSLQVAFAHADYRVPIADANGSADSTERPSAEVIPFPRLRRAVGE